MPIVSLIEDYRDDEKYREMFFVFVNMVFPKADFRTWYEYGFWSDRYIPFSLVADGKIISNVSISKMDLLIDGVRKKGIQFGTVGTIPEFRNKGLARRLMEYALDKFNADFDVFFLYANKSVLDFYPKFGFRRYKESVYEADLSEGFAPGNPRRLDINDAEDRTIIYKLLKRRRIQTGLFGAENYEFITFWHMLNIFPEDIFYLNDPELLLIMTSEKSTLNIWEVVFTAKPDWQTIIPELLIRQNLSKIRYHFPPDQSHFHYDRILEEDTLLFIRSGIMLKGNRFRFPVTATS
jgi:GNAT superfamily N-acetyltransferase